MLFWTECVWKYKETLYNRDSTGGVYIVITALYQQIKPFMLDKLQCHKSNLTGTLMVLAEWCKLVGSEVDSGESGSDEPTTGDVEGGVETSVALPVMSR